LAWFEQFVKSGIAFASPVLQFCCHFILTPSRYTRVTKL
jgi:hypothetical protein